MSRKRKPIRIRGRPYGVLDELFINGRRYLLLKQFGRDGRRRYLAAEPKGAPGEFRMILQLPRDVVSRQHVAVLKRISQHTEQLPRIIESEFRKDVVYVVTHWVDGTTLESYLRTARRGRTAWPSPTEALKRYRGLTHAVSRMYEDAGIIHGDLKPENLVITARPSRLVMIDFGSAWSADGTAVRSPGDGCSLAYAAPEHLLGVPQVDFRSDQFSASVVLYELLTDEVPYAKMGGLAGLPENRHDFQGEYVPPSQKARDRRYVPRKIWSAIDRVVATALALDPDQRYQSTRQWRDAVDQAYRLLLISIERPHEKAGRLDRAITWLAGRLERIRERRASRR